MKFNLVSTTAVAILGLATRYLTLRAPFHPSSKHQRAATSIRLLFQKGENWQSISHSALAGHNCKCQDPSGTGPQYNSMTESCCGNGAVTETCPSFQPNYHGDQHHQVRSHIYFLVTDQLVTHLLSHYPPFPHLFFKGMELTNWAQCSATTNCINSGAFDQCCRDEGGPGAYCWWGRGRGRSFKKGTSVDVTRMMICDFRAFKTENASNF